ncbi:CBS domain-containing protein [Nitrosomonas sp. ANs5]|uniref:CBS domain-containing protein n=1 Tax=Nitrosomonas sp. ANs5 TaxID=3423941 RepID=UPI003D34EE2E
MKTKLEIPVEVYTTPHPVTAREDNSIDDMKALMQQHHVRHLPIVSAGKVVGIVSDRDLRMAAALNLNEKNLIKAADLMTLEVATFHCATPLQKVALEMAEKKIGSVLVNDDKGELLGIFTVTDALHALIKIMRGEK